jgi:hypothetical protein
MQQDRVWLMVLLVLLVASLLVRKLSLYCLLLAECYLRVLLLSNPWSL